MFFYRDRDTCFGFGSLFVGSTGGLALGYYSKIFDPMKPMDKLTIDMKVEKPAAPKTKKVFKQLPRIQLGGNQYWRYGGQIAGTMICYSFLECKFQGKYGRRSLFDCLFAGAITGGAFGLRGTPGGKVGARVGAAGFAAYAGLMYLIFRC